MPSSDIKVPLQDHQPTLTTVEIMNIVFSPTGNVKKKAQVFSFKSVYHNALHWVWYTLTHYYKTTVPTTMITYTQPNFTQTSNNVTGMRQTRVKHLILKSQLI
jgi:hypothetical protein